MKGIGTHAPIDSIMPFFYAITALLAKEGLSSSKHSGVKIYCLSELPSPLWASLTPISETWSISHLLDELAAESEAMKKQKEGVNSYVHK